MENQITGYNLTFPIYNADGTPFYDLVLREATYDSVVMSLGDKITGDVYYKDNTLVFAMTEYIVFEGVKYVLVNPPTVVREGMASDNSDLKGMAKYSFEFYHPMYNLSNLPFTDVAVSDDEKKYLSQNKTFSWIGCLFDPTKSGLVEKLNKNLQDTLWEVNVSSDAGSLEKMAVITEDVLSFDKQTIADVLKTAYDTWEVPFVISTLNEPNENGKQYFITFGMPTEQVLDENGNEFIFQFGKGVGLKNNSRTPKNNKIVTRIAGQGSTSNIPFGYPQIEWLGNPDWEYTINNDKNDPNSYPIYDGIVAGQPKRLIKHPFTRSNLMPSIYTETVNKKVNPNTSDYNPSIDIKDYYDAPFNYPNPIDEHSPCYEFHEFEDIKPQLGEKRILACQPYSTKQENAISSDVFLMFVLREIEKSTNENEKFALRELYDVVKEGFHMKEYTFFSQGGAYTFNCNIKSDGTFLTIKYTSDNVNFEKIVFTEESEIAWDDTMDDDGNYIQSYFKLKLPQLDFDLYASASVTEEMKINMRSGACIGCTFGVYVDWDDYKNNFYDADGNFAPNNYYDAESNPNGNRHLDKYPNSKDGSITVICLKDNETFGTLIPNIYQQPKGETQYGAGDGDEFVILGISMPLTYISNAEKELDEAMMEYMLENNTYYYDYPLKFDEYFLATHVDILSQIKNNVAIKFQYHANGLPDIYYVKQINIKFGEQVLPQYSITLSDDVEIVLNKIGQVTDDVSRMRVEVSELQKYYSDNIINEIRTKLSRIEDDVCQGRITFQQGLDAIGNAIFSDELRSKDFESGLYTGRGWRIDELGNSEFESLRVRSYLEVVELLINRLQAQEGDTMFTDNDQIERVDKYVDETDGSVSYILSLKEKYEGYVTSQQYGNILRGVINTLAAKQAGVSDESGVSVEVDGENKYYTSWCRIIGTHNTDSTLNVNQVRVVLYGDYEVPAQRNFEPCELMTIARWGCVDYSDPNDANYETIKASIQRRQRMFMISTTDGRVVKYTGVDSPILKNGNYGVTIGELPDFVKQYPDVKIILDQVGQHTDWLYAQGVVVGNYVKISREGLPIPVTVYCGDWVNGSTLAQPTAGNGIYYYNKYNSDTLQNETHIVSHRGCQWQCLQSQPVVLGDNTTYYEPQIGSSYWGLVSGNTIYKLMPSVSQILKRKDGTTVPQSSEYITCSVIKTIGEANISPQPTEYTLQWRYSTNESWVDYENYKPIVSNVNTTLTFRLLIDNKIVDKCTVPLVVDGQDGTSPILADLDNEMSGVACDKDGNVASEQSVSTNVSLWKGSTQQIIDSISVKIGDTTLGNSYSTSTSSIAYYYKCTISDSNVVVYVRNGATIESKTDVTIVLNNNTLGTFNLTLTINAVKAGNDGTAPTIYEILPSTSQIKVSRTDSGDYNPSTVSLTCGYIKKTGNSQPTIVSDVTESFDGYNLYFRKKYKSSTTWTNHKLYTNYKADLTSLGVSVYDGVEFVICTNTQNTVSNTTLIGVIDRETVPIVSDGTKGVDGQDGTNGKDAAYISIKGTCRSLTSNPDCVITIYNGTNSTTINNHYIKGDTNVTYGGTGLALIKVNRTTLEIYGTPQFYGVYNDASRCDALADAINNTSSDYFVVLMSRDATRFNTNLVQAIKNCGGIDVENMSVGRYPFAFIGYKGLPQTYALQMQGELQDANPAEVVAYVADGMFTTARSGKDGAQGKIGRMYYYAQEWFDSTSISYSVSDIEAPFFKYNNNYWVFNPTQNGTYTMHDMGAPTNTNANWQIMATDFKYLISEAIFSNFAKLGSFIISGDWLISTNGTVNGVASSAYNQFDAAHPNDNTGTNFIPNYCVDGRTGTSYYNDAHLRGSISAKSLMTNFEDIRTQGEFFAGLDTTVNGKDISGTWNFITGGQVIILPTNQYAYIGQRVILYNPYIEYSYSSMTYVRAGSCLQDDDEWYVDSREFLRGYAKPRSGSAMQPVKTDDSDPIKEISFFNGILELMCVPCVGANDGQLCDWCIVNIGTNFFELETQEV